MRKIILLAALAASVTLCRSQSIVYSNYSIKAATSAYKVIGKVGKNIIVWVCIDKHYSSEILIYDNKFKLINKVPSDILKSDVNPSPIFFNNNDSFCAAYKYNKNKLWQYRIAFFNEKGNLTSEKILDSIQVFKSEKDTTYYNYKFLQSADKKTICFIKFAYDKNNYVLKFNCNFFTSSKSFYEYFALPFDGNHDWFADFLIDNNKNFFFVIYDQTDSVSHIKIIKKNFSDDYMLIEQKDVAKISLHKESLRILNTANSYIVYGFGESKNYSIDSLNKNEGIFYLWRVDSSLNNNPGDNIYNNINGGSLNDVIVSANEDQLIVVQTEIEDINQPLQRDYNIPPQSSSSEEPQRYYVLRQGDDRSMDLNYYYNPSHFVTPSPTSSGNKPNDNPIDQSITSNVVLFNIDKLNKVEWTKNFKMYSKDISSNMILDGIIIVNSNKTQLIYPVTTGKKNFIKHIVILNNGVEKEQNEIVWHSSNSFIIDQASQVDDNTIIFPILKGDKLNFLRMNLE